MDGWLLVLIVTALYSSKTATAGETLLLPSHKDPTFFFYFLFLGTSWSSSWVGLSPVSLRWFFETNDVKSCRHVVRMVMRKVSDISSRKPLPQRKTTAICVRYQYFRSPLRNRPDELRVAPGSGPYCRFFTVSAACVRARVCDDTGADFGKCLQGFCCSK